MKRVKMSGESAAKAGVKALEGLGVKAEAVRSARGVWYVVGEPVKAPRTKAAKRAPRTPGELFEVKVAPRDWRGATTLKGAVEAVRDVMNTTEDGGGRWYSEHRLGIIRQHGKVVARVSYNGRVWKVTDKTLNDFPVPEIKI